LISLCDLEAQVGFHEICPLLDILSRSHGFQPVTQALEFPGQQGRVPELPGTLVRRGYPALYDQSIGVELVTFDVAELVAGHP
jgi:hypothetical protein